jgi:uncharacterized damage-inducible protein DinB
MIVRALVKQWPGGVLIYVHELPGVVVAGDFADDAIDRLADGVEAHLNWLAAHGFDMQPYLELEIEVAEQREASQSRGLFFEADCEPASSDQIEQALQIAALARRDLVDLYRSVSNVRRDRPLSGDDWSIADHLRHIAEAEVWYASNLTSQQLGDLPHDPLEAMRASARYADGALRSLNGADRERVFQRSGQVWTAHKVMRRMVGHLREHYPWVRELARR